MPRFGELLPTDVWAASARTLTAFAAQDLFLYPAIDSTYLVTNPQSAASVNTFGSWAQISANVGAGKTLLGAFCQMNSGGAAGIFELEFGEGASGSEAAVTRLEGVAPQAAAQMVGYFPLHRALTGSARLSCRVKDDNSLALAYYVAVLIA